MNLFEKRRRGEVSRKLSNNIANGAPQMSRLHKTPSKSVKNKGDAHRFMAP